MITILVLPSLLTFSSGYLAQQLIVGKIIIFVSTTSFDQESKMIISTDTGTMVTIYNNFSILLLYMLFR